MFRIRPLALALVAVLLAALALPALAQDDGAADDPADVTVIHGIPDATVDVYVNGALTLEDFEPTTITDPLELPAGTYDLAIYAADADPAESDPVVAADGVEVPAGINASIIAHLTADGEPGLAVFVNDTSTIDHLDARVAVRHTAAAPAVDVYVDGSAAITDLANPDEVVTTLPEGEYEIAVAPAGTSVDDAVIGPLDLPLPGDTLTIVYAVFSAADGDITALVQTVPLGVEDGNGEDPAARAASRLSGDSRVDTAIAISQRAFPEGADVVYLARQDVLADSMAAGVLTDGPILLVPNCGQLPAQVAAEISRVDPQEVIALGGVLAVCDSILQQAAAA